MNVTAHNPLLKETCLEARVIGAVLMMAAVYKLAGFLDYEYYRFMFQHLPEPWIKARYCLSIGLRLMLVLVGWGVTRQDDFYRKAAMAVAAANLLAMYFKHPFEVFYHVAVLAEAGFPAVYPALTGQEVLAFPYYPWISMMVHVMIDTGFSALVIFYLTRPGIKGKFR